MDSTELVLVVFPLTEPCSRRMMVHSGHDSVSFRHHAVQAPPFLLSTSTGSYPISRSNLPVSLPGYIVRACLHPPRKRGLHLFTN